MRVLDVDQNSEAWLEFRKGKIGGSKVKGIKPLSRGKLKGLPEGSAGFWKLLAERLAVSKDGESDMERGHRLEPMAIEKVNSTYGINLVRGKVWQSSENEYMYISPDADDGTDKPVIAMESKAFDTDKHLHVIYNDMVSKTLPDYWNINSLPDDNVDQVVDYFVINPNLQKLYWTLVNDMVAFEHLECYTIEISRADIEPLIETSILIQNNALKKVDKIISFLLEGGKDG